MATLRIARVAGRSIGGIGRLASNSSNHLFRAQTCTNQLLRQTRLASTSTPPTEPGASVKDSESTDAAEEGIQTAAEEEDVDEELLELQRMQQETERRMQAIRARKLAKANASVKETREVQPTAEAEEVDAAVLEVKPVEEEAVAELATPEVKAAMEFAQEAQSTNTGVAAPELEASEEKIASSTTPTQPAAELDSARSTGEAESLTAEASETKAVDEDIPASSNTIETALPSTPSTSPQNRELQAIVAELKTLKIERGSAQHRELQDFVAEIRALKAERGSVQDRELQAIQAHMMALDAEREKEQEPTARRPRAEQAAYLAPMRRESVYNVPTADLQMRSYNVHSLEFMADFAMRAAFYLNLSASGPVPLPRLVKRWTVPRGHFIHKKKQENYERITYRRLIQIKDGSAESVELWLAFLRKHTYYGIGMKANVWEFAGLNVAKDLDAQMERMRQHVEPVLGQFAFKEGSKMADGIIDRVIEENRRMGTGWAAPQMITPLLKRSVNVNEGRPGGSS